MNRGVKINLGYQIIVLLVGAVLAVNSALEGEYLFFGLGILLIIGSLGTVNHIRTKQHNINSKLPEDIKIER